MATVAEAMVNRASTLTMIVLDPNCRPSAMIDEHSCRERLARLISRSDVVKVSAEDLDFLAPDVTLDVAAATMTSGGARWVIVSDGAQSVHAFGANRRIEVDVPPVDVVDTVGAGDALVGGFIAWWTGHGYGRDELDDTELVRQALEAAIVVATVTCTRRGAEPPFAHELSDEPSWSSLTN